MAVIGPPKSGWDSSSSLEKFVFVSAFPSWQGQESQCTFILAKYFLKTSEQSRAEQRVILDKKHDGTITSF
jgi:hypothetical protein